MRILIVTSEAVPYVKTGGLADVTGALLKEFRARKHRVSLMLPLYKGIRDGFSLFRTGKSVRVSMGGVSRTGEIWKSDSSSHPEAYFIDCDDLFGRAELYGTAGGDYPDNALRFAFFSRAALVACVAMGVRPDVIHCNDWQTALVPLYLKTFYRRHELLRDTATVFTIHNLGYQGLFHPSNLVYTGLGWEYFVPERLEFYGMLNFMKAGLIYADLLSTVSSTYAREVLAKEHGFGLEGVLDKRKGDLFGILNGVDYRVWDPRRDMLLPVQYGGNDLKGKAECKKVLLKKTGLRNEKLPLFSVVSRLSSQKGLDLVASCLGELAELQANVIVLGRGEELFQKLLTEAAKRLKGKVFVRLGFEESLAHLVYAGSDFFVMPSRYEPCGLGQLIALRYGTLPVARKTGGLADTIRDYDHMRSEGTGFLFADYTPGALLDAVKRALCVYSDKKSMGKMVSEAMKADFSWAKSAGQYLTLYEKALGKVRG